MKQLAIGCGVKRESESLRSVSIKLSEPVIGSIRSEFLDPVVVAERRYLKRLLIRNSGYYHQWREHRSLDTEAPDCRAERSTMPNDVVEFPAVQGLHHYVLQHVA